jgi:hypothetical protein
VRFSLAELAGNIRQGPFPRGKERAHDLAATTQRGAPSQSGDERTDIKASVGSGDAALVAMMKPTDLREGDNLALIGRLL